MRGKEREKKDKMARKVPLLFQIFLIILFHNYNFGAKIIYLGKRTCDNFVFAAFLFYSN